MLRNSRKWNTETILFCTAFLYRLGIFFTLVWWASGAGLNYPKFGSDASGYWNLATEITQHSSYGELLRPPGYPLYLAFFQTFLGTDVKAQYAAVMVQIACTAFAVILLYRLLKRVSTEHTAMAASLFFALEPNSAYYSTLLLSDALFVFLLITCTYVFLTKTTYRAFFGAGFVLGAAMTVRPIAQFFPAVAILYLCIIHGVKRNIIVSSAAFFLGTLILPLPWMVYNHNTHDSFILSSSGPNTYYKYVMPQFEAWRTGKNIDDVYREFSIALDTAVAKGTLAETFMQSEVKRIVTDNASAYTVYHTVKTVPFFLGDGIREILQKLKLLEIEQLNITTLILQHKFKGIAKAILAHPPLFIAVAGGVFWSAVLLLAVAGLWHAYRMGNHVRQHAIFFAVTILYFVLLTGAATSTRHRMPALPFIAALSAIGFYALADKRKPDHTKHISFPEFSKETYPPRT
ncbi:MAG: hypothetical protein G01um101470_155 [Parcubacteria group bacterium Gr01-1014_70]|nr:MAG: hypothetical protein G01um101470_155 [Parcubacteria group bacterium Gr01-1014_70]